MKLHDSYDAYECECNCQGQELPHPQKLAIHGGGYATGHRHEDAPAEKSDRKHCNHVCNHVCNQLQSYVIMCDRICQKNTQKRNWQTHRRKALELRLSIIPYVSLPRTFKWLKDAQRLVMAFAGLFLARFTCHSLSKPVALVISSSMRFTSAWNMPFAEMS